MFQPHPAQPGEAPQKWWLSSPRQDPRTGTGLDELTTLKKLLYNLTDTETILLNILRLARFEILNPVKTLDNDLESQNTNLEIYLSLWISSLAYSSLSHPSSIPPSSFLSPHPSSSFSSFPSCPLRQGLRLALNLWWSCCHSNPNPGIIGLCQDAWLHSLLLNQQHEGDSIW